MGPVTPAMKRFLSAERYAVIGKVLSDRSRWDNKVLRWYQTHKYPVTPVRPDNPSSEAIEGLGILTNPLAIPSLPSTSVSIIIHPSKSLGILQNLFSNPYTLPHTIPCPRLSSSNFLLFQAIRPHSSKTCYPHRSSQKHSSSPFQRFNSWPQRWKGWAGRMRKQPNVIWS